MSDRRVRVVLGGETVCDTTRAVRLLETSHPPTWYLPRADFAPGALREADGTSLCEWKGVARYLDVVGGGVVAARAAWTYPSPVSPYEHLVDHVALYPAAMDACFVDDELVRAQEGGIYGGWITDDVAGPFKGAPGSRSW